MKLAHQVIDSIENLNESATPKLIYLMIEDDDVAYDLAVFLDHAEYRIKRFTYAELELANCEQDLPSAIIMEVSVNERKDYGIDLGSKLQLQVEKHPPIIAFSSVDNIETRCAATKAGADRFFSAPVDYQKLQTILDTLIQGDSQDAYRILLIDSDEATLNIHSNMLKSHGAIVEDLSNPYQVLDALEDFSPDIIITEVDLNGCSGSQLIKMIRQDDKWALIPILFLTSQADDDEDITAVSLGADYLIKKPVESNTLMNIVSAVAKRSRENVKTQLALQSALRENQFQLYTMNQHDIVSTAGVDGNIIYVNDNFCEISGYKRVELIGKNHRILKSNYHSNEFFGELWRTISSGKVWKGTICNRKKNGDVYWVKSTIVPFLDANGLPYKFVSARTDITEHRLSQERLQQSQDLANLGNWEWDIKTGELYWSEKICSLYGLPREAMQTTYSNFMKSIHSDDREYVQLSITNCIEEGIEYNIEYRVVWPDGSIHWLHEGGDVIRDDSGNPSKMIGVVRDVTNRRVAHELLRESEEKYRLLFELSEDPMWTIFKGHFIMANKAAAKLLGYENVDELKDTHPSDLSPEYQPDNQWSFDKANEMMSIAFNRGYHRFEWNQLKKNGEEVPVEISLTRIPYQGEDALFSVWRDITKRKSAERNLIKAREEAEQSSIAKSNFLSSMSHELRTPMNAIMGFGQLLKMDMDHPLVDDQQESVDEILRASEHLLELINEVLDLTKIESGKFSLEIEPVQVSAVMVEALNLIMPLAENRGIEIKIVRNNQEITFQDMFQQTSAVKADYTRLKQVLLNILSNAVKYNNDNGNITIQCHHFEKNYTRISITDTGDGLTPEQQELLFVPFERLGVEESSIEGIGIGLVITQSIIELMGGRMGVESFPGEGSTFWFELPRAHDVVSETSEVCMIKDTKEDASIDENREYTVLYIEDNLANLRLVSQLMERLPNVHMQSAAEPELGLELAFEHTPDLILLDINLPGMDGYEVFEKLRDREETRNTPVVAISANAMPKNIQKGLGMGFDDYITKPIDVRALLKTVEKILQKTE